MKRWMHSNSAPSSITISSPGVPLPVVAWQLVLLNKLSIWNLALGAGEKLGPETGGGGDGSTTGPFPQIPFLSQGDEMSRENGEGRSRPWKKRLLTQGREKHTGGGSEQLLLNCARKIYTSGVEGLLGKGLQMLSLCPPNYKSLSRNPRGCSWVC